MTDTQLTAAGTVIKNETTAGANTATRVGTILNDIVASKINNDKIVTAVTGASDANVPSEKAAKAYVDGVLTAKENTSNKSNDGTFSANSTTLFPTQQAAKTYVDGATIGFINDRGNYNASSNVFPSTGGSGTAGAIRKGNLWTISVAGTLGGNSVLVGYSVRALIDAPAQTAGNWSILNVGLGYVPESSSNKSQDITADAGSTAKYPSVNAVQNFVAASLGTAIVKRAIIQVSSAELLALNSNRKTLIAAQGANTIIYLMNTVIKYSYSTAPYVYTYPPYFVLGNQSRGIFNSIINQSVDCLQCYTDGTNSIDYSTSIVNSPLQLAMDGFNPTSGGGFLEIHITYTVIYLTS